MIKVEDFQQYGKDQYEAAVSSVSSLTKGFQAIAASLGDYTKKSFEDGNSFVEKLTGVKSFDKAVELQSEYTKSAYEAFVAEAQKIGEIYSGLAKEAYKPFESYVSKMTPPAAH